MDTPTKQKTHHMSLSEQASHFIGSIKQTVRYQVDNTFILHGYRINYNSPKLILKSLFHPHNELINVWTHLIGTLIVIALVVYVSTSFTYVVYVKDQLSKDIDNIFNVITDEVTSLKNTFDQNLDRATHANYTELLQQLETFEKNIFTRDHIQGLMLSLSSAKDIFKLSDDNVMKVYGQALEEKLSSVKRNLIEQIDSESFDWMEIYKFNYTSTNLNLKFQGVRLRKPSDPLHISRWPIFVFLASAIMCLLGSSLFHLFFQMSEVANRYLMRVDYAGISLLILGSTFPPYYYGFYCEVGLRYIYLFTVGTACFAVYVISIFDFIHKEQWRQVKGLMYGSLGLFAGVPAVHLYLRELYREEVSDFLPFNDSFIYYVLMGSSYLGGLVFYVYKIPERFNPGKYDIFGQSHQIWHCFVFLGVMFSYLGALDNLDDRRYTPCLIK